MTIRGHLISQLLDQPGLTGRGIQKIVSSENMGNPHFSIIDGNGQLVGHQAVSPPDHEIIGAGLKCPGDGSIE